MEKEILLNNSDFKEELFKMQEDYKKYSSLKTFIDNGIRITIHYHYFCLESKFANCYVWFEGYCPSIQENFDFSKVRISFNGKYTNKEDSYIYEDDKDLKALSLISNWVLSHNWLTTAYELFTIEKLVYEKIQNKIEKDNTINNIDFIK
ncbi:MAG TPA: hypothetical protein P5513_08385 [Candidatus Diapherotrites archaeon]|nr:hypothetical protein [Candidatus Diapherotrites archaeon]